MGPPPSASFRNTMTDNKNVDEVQKQLENLEKNHKSKYVIDQHRTAYSCVEGSKGFFSVYNDMEDTVSRYGSFTADQLIQGWTPGSVGGKGFKLEEVLAISPHTFLVKLSNPYQRFYFVTAEQSSPIVSHIGNNLQQAALNHNFPQRLSGLSKVRSNGDFDFTLVTDGGTIPVHTLVLKACMPFFAAMMDSKMSESSLQKLDMPHPHLWVEAMVSYFYGEPFEVEFEQATGLLILADVYDIPELLRLAVARVKSEQLDMTKCLAGWKNAFDAQNDEIRAYFAAFARKQWNELEQSAELLHGLTQEEAVELMLDVSRAKMGGV